MDPNAFLPRPWPPCAHSDAVSTSTGTLSKECDIVTLITFMLCIHHWIQPTIAFKNAIKAQCQRQYPQGPIVSSVTEFATMVLFLQHVQAVCSAHGSFIFHVMPVMHFTRRSSNVQTSFVFTSSLLFQPPPALCLPTWVQSTMARPHRAS